MKIPVFQFKLDEEDKKAVLGALDAGEISGSFGKSIPEFEQGFATYCGTKYGVAVMNGSVAIHLALLAMEIGPGDEVIIPTFTHMAAAFAVIQTGAKPVAIDIEPDTMNMDPTLLEERITPKTKAILVAHIYGHPADMDPILAIAKKHNLRVIEDAAEAHGAEYKGRKAGSLGDIATFSFYANKIITTGEGGMVVTSNKECADRARSLKDQAYGDTNKFMHKDIGFNYRMTGYQAALGVAQLQKIDKLIEKRRNVAKYYLDKLKGIPALQLPVEKPYAKNVFWMFQVVLRGSLSQKRDQIAAELKVRGIDTRPAFLPFNLQEIFLSRGLAKPEDCPKANFVSEAGFYLPTGDMNQEELDYVVENLKEILNAE
jgi:perosamine synthetase